MNTAAVEILVPLISMTMLFGIVYVITSAWHRQRMAMIEKGLTAAEMVKRPDPYRSLKTGMLLIGVGCGLLFGYLIKTHVMMDENDNPLPYFMMVAICGGVAMLAHFFIIQRKNGGQ